MTTVDIPELSLVVLVGITGSGKSTFARRHFAPTQVLSSDAFRAMVADDENDQSASGDAFELLHQVAAKRLRAGRLTIVDATNVQRYARAELVKLAREYDVLPVAIVFDVPEPVCWKRTQSRPDRAFGREVLRRQQRDLRQSLGRLGREGFRKVHVLHSEEEVDAAQVRLAKLFNDKRELTGPFDIIGDVHGCRAELEALLARLGWQVDRDEAGQPVNATHPAGRTAVFLGDLVDRGPDTPGVLRLAMGMVAAGTALCVAGNHEQKLLRKLRGADRRSWTALSQVPEREVQERHGLAETLAQLEAQPPAFAGRVADFIDGLVSHYVLDEGRLVVAHAGLKEEYQGRASGRVRSFALYGETTGETDEYGLPVRYPWARDYRGRATVVYGHTPTPTPEWVNNTICVDTGCVFGGSLTALRYPERELVSQPAEREYYAPVRPLTAPAAPRSPTPSADPAPQTSADPAPRTDLIKLTDVVGRRHLDTGYGTVTVSAEQAAAALEVAGRFAVDPRWLVWLPPTMTPPSTSTQDGHLEHPGDAFADYRQMGVTRLICEAKHMGSRAVVLACRDAGVAQKRFGVSDGSTGAIYTRTGRPFFDPDTTEALLARVRAAMDGLCSLLDTDWVLLDCELLPWSAKALGLIQEQYASVGAAAGAAVPAALDVLDATAARGVDGDVASLRARMVERAENAELFVSAYRRYVAPTDGLAGVTLAPFAVLAGEGAPWAKKDRAWHHDHLNLLFGGDPALFTPTDYRMVDLDDEATVADATNWWTELTEAGGEGMVVKPSGGLSQGSGQGRRVQPGIKCRGREYLRIIYGPDYLAHLDDLRNRSVGHKRALALREHALGLAALDRLAEGAATWRIHQLVLSILACESEPVDPRL
jgi:polynucleotide kinase-phosphatase